VNFSLSCVELQLGVKITYSEYLFMIISRFLIFLPVMQFGASTLVVFHCNPFMLSHACCSSENVCCGETKWDESGRGEPVVAMIMMQRGALHEASDRESRLSNH
jgi:hypothetical protein